MLQFGDKSINEYILITIDFFSSLFNMTRRKVAVWCNVLNNSDEMLVFLNYLIYSLFLLSS